MRATFDDSRFLADRLDALGVELLFEVLHGWNRTTTYRG